MPTVEPTRPPATDTLTPTLQATPTPLLTATPSRTPTATPPPPNPALPLLTVRVQAIQVMDDDGKRVTPITPAQVGQWIDNANEAWAGASIRFLYDPSVDFSTIRNTLVNSMESSRDDPDTLEDRHLANEIAARYPGKLVILIRYGAGSRPVGQAFSGEKLNFVAGVGFNNTVVCGYQNIGLIAHEIGHYFGLAHTHTQAFKNIEEAETYLKAHGNKPSAFDGDKLDDTLPDPYLGVDEIQCQPVTSITLNGIAFPVQRANLMAYYYKVHTDLTPQQIERARWFFAWRAKNGMARPVNANVSGAIEFESLPVKAATNLAAKEQKLSSTQSDWSNDRHLFCRAYENSQITFAVTVDKPGRYALNLYATYALDYGQIQTFVDGKPLGAPIDLYGYAVRPTGKISIGEIDLSAGAHDLEFRVVGKNERSTGYSFGLDAFTLLIKP